MFTIFYVVTCNYHEYCYEQQQEQSYETTKNCVSDYPLSNTESAERGVKRGILRNRNERCAVADVRSSKWKSVEPLVRYTSSIVTADVDIPDKVLEKRIHLAEVRAKRKSKAFLLRGFLGIKSRSKSKSSETKWRRRTVGLGLLLVLAIE
jgi:hypothetical protein